MTFGEKLLKFRKERGLSQEALAEQLNTTRQAISKWENNQGYPETEKLLMLSNLFAISVDSLLKDGTNESGAEENGYYVSRECAEGYLLQEQRLAKRVSAGMGILIGAVVPFLSQGLNTPITIGTTIVLLIISIGVLATTMFIEDQYKQLSKERLIMDNSFYKELKSRYELKKKKFVFIALLGITLLVIGGIGFKNVSTSIFPVKELCCAFFTVGLYCLCYILEILNSYETLLNSEERQNKFHILLWKKAKERLTK